MADILGKLGSSLDKGIRNISSRGKELVETTRLKSEIRDIEKAIEEKFSRLGRKVFEKMNQGAIAQEDLRDDATEITALFKKINQLNEAIRDVEVQAVRTRLGSETILCPKCRSSNRAGETFCSACGAALAADEASGDAIQCKACGSRVKPGMKFCGSCGGKVD